jgi:hypothetical protein
MTDGLGIKLDPGAVNERYEFSNGLAIAIPVLSIPAIAETTEASEQ